MNQSDKKVPGTFKEHGFMPKDFRDIIAKPLYITWAEQPFAAKFWWENHIWYAQVNVFMADMGTFFDTNPNRLKEGLWKKFGESKYSGGELDQLK